MQKRRYSDAFTFDGMSQLLEKMRKIEAEKILIKTVRQDLQLEQEKLKQQILALLSRCYCSSIKQLLTTRTNRKKYDPMYIDDYCQERENDVRVIDLLKQPIQDSFSFWNDFLPQCIQQFFSQFLKTSIVYDPSSLEDDENLGRYTVYLHNSQTIVSIIWCYCDKNYIAFLANFCLSNIDFFS